MDYKRSAGVLARITIADIRALEDGRRDTIVADDQLSVASSSRHRNSGGGGRPGSARGISAGGVSDLLPYPSYIEEDEEPGGSELGYALGGDVQRAGDVDELAFLMQDTPLVRLKAKERDLDRAVEQELDGWKILRLQQEVLALAKLHLMMSKGADHRPLLLPTAHFQLAQRYSDLGCVTQASEHLQKSIEEMPKHGQGRKDVQALQRGVHICMAEALLKAEPPKPQVALQHLLKAAGQQTIEDVDYGQEVEVSVLIGQAYIIMADSQLHEARGTRVARNRLGISLDEVDVNIRKAEMAKRVLEVTSLRQRYMDLASEAQAEEEYEAKLVDTASEHLDKASTAIMGVIETMEKKLGRDAARQDKLVHQLIRQGSSISIKLAECHALRGDYKSQEVSLKEILSNHEVYQCIPIAMLARVRKELGIVMVKNKKYDTALECYEELKALQQDRYQDEYGQQQLAVAECYKLCGDVHVAKKEFSRARESFGLAYDTLIMELGPDHQLVVDLEHRLKQLDSYDGQAGPSTVHEEEEEEL